MEHLSDTTLPQGFSYEWTGTALQEKEAAGQTTVILGLAVLFAYLFLVALYESWTIPFGPAFRQRRHPGRWARCSWRASTTTSMPRSASWC